MASRWIEAGLALALAAAPHARAAALARADAIVYAPADGLVLEKRYRTEHYLQLQRLRIQRNKEEQVDEQGLEIVGTQELAVRDEHRAVADGPRARPRSRCAARSAASG
jgi:hypothetical protein